MPKKQETFLEKHHIGWPAITLACVTFATLGMVLTFADATTKATVIEWIGWAGFALSQFLKPMFARKKKQSNEQS